MAKFTSLYKCPDGTDFTVEWEDSEFERHGWRWDQMHCPLPLTPLSQDLWKVKIDGFGRAANLTGAPARGQPTIRNGYVFNRQVSFDDDPVARAAIRARDAENRVDRVLGLWDQEYRPEVQALTRSLLSLDGDGRTLRQLVDRLDQLHAITRRQGELHTLTMGPAGIAANRFIDFCIAEIGPEGEAIALELMQGFPNKSLESANELWELSREAKLRPKVEELLRTTTPSEFLQRVAGVPGGEEFRRLFDEFLEEYGLRNESFSELSLRTWREDPRFPLFVIRRYLDTPEGASPAAMHEKTVRRREEAVADMQPRFTGDLEKLGRFRGWLKSAQQRTVLLEDHNFFIDQQGFSAMRAPCLAIGRGLAEQGTIADPEDVFYLQEAEIREASVRQHLRLAGLVAERRFERERWLRVLPPEAIGAGPVELSVQTGRFFGTMPEESEDRSVIKGIGGSPGVISGVARLVLTLDDVDRLAAGEILVTYATAPPWTPLFGVVAGVVTDVGGRLSHCAIVAREYGIPAVVGTKVATARIRDGMRITVDGTQGIVRLGE